MLCSLFRFRLFQSLLSFFQFENPLLQSIPHSINLGKAVLYFILHTLRLGQDRFNVVAQVSSKGDPFRILLFRVTHAHPIHGPGITATLGPCHDLIDVCFGLSEQRCQLADFTKQCTQCRWSLLLFLLLLFFLLLLLQ